MDRVKPMQYATMIKMAQFTTRMNSRWAVPDITLLYSRSVDILLKVVEKTNLQAC